MNPLISVIIPAYDHLKLLEHVLHSFMHQTIPQNNYQVIIVDDGSNEPITSLREIYPSYIFIRLERNMGRSIARNEGLKYAIGERILFIDADTIPASNLIEAHLQACEDEPSSMIVIGYRYELAHEDYRHAIKYQDMFPDLREKLYERNTCNLYSWPAPWQVCYSNNLSIPKHLLESVGGFDEHFQTWGVEDIELGYRLCKNHAKFRLARNAVSFHQWHSRNKEAENASNDRNFHYFLKKHLTFDIELLFTKTAIDSSQIEKQRSLQGYSIQQAIRDVTRVCNGQKATWRTTSNLSAITFPCAVICAGNEYLSAAGWQMFHPLLQTNFDPISLLGINLPYPSRSFSSVLLTKIFWQLPRLQPAMLLEAFRLAPDVWLELPVANEGNIPVDIANLVQICNCTIQLPDTNRQLCRAVSH